MTDTTGTNSEDLEPDAARRAKLLRGRIAIVTGSDSGIGRAIAQALALEGADVAVTYHSDEDGAKATADQVEAAGSRAVVRHLDVREEGSVTSFMAAVVDDLGVPDILVNCAGIGGSKPLTETTFEDFDNVLKTDLYGPFSSVVSLCGDAREGKVARSSISPPCMKRSLVRATFPTAQRKAAY